MRAGEASRTAQYMALSRAPESARGATRSFDDPYASAGLRERGLSMDQDLGAADYRARCYGPAAGATRGDELYGIAVTHVAGGRA